MERLSPIHFLAHRAGQISSQAKLLLTHRWAKNALHYLGNEFIKSSC